jgi:hypothetical protein
MDPNSAHPNPKKAASAPYAASGAKGAPDVAALTVLSAQELREEYRRLHRTQPPRVSRDLLIRMIGYRVQELAHGGLSKATRRQLQALTKELESNGTIAPICAPQLRTGARLVREWRGKTHTVTVREDGFEYLGQIYSSLTHIAQVITGAHWSGPRFFGLTGTQRPSRSEVPDAGESADA